MLNFSEYAPDQPVFEGQSISVENVLALTANSYGPVKAFTTQGTALTNRCQGAGSFRGPDGVIGNYAGDLGKLYKWNGTTWVDISRLAGGAYATAAIDGWSFAQFGDYCVACNGLDATQYILISVSTNFAALAGAPVARFAATVRDFMVLGRLAGLNKVRWSAINDVTAWTIGINQADEQSFPEGGRVMGLGGGRYMIVFLETSVQRGTYVGPDLIFQFESISQERGCAAEGSVASFEDTAFFLAGDGFFMIPPAQGMVPIGDQKVDRWFWNNVNQTYLYRITATIDPKAKLYLVAFPSTSSADGTPDTILAYNWTIGRWSRISQSLDFLAPMRTNLGYTLDSLDTLYPNLDTMPYSLDSALFMGSPLGKVAGFGTDKKVGFFEGANMAATIDTEEYQLSEGRRSLVRWTKPMIDGGTLTVGLGTRNLPNEAVAFGSDIAVNGSGMAPQRCDARYHRARVKVAAAGTWTHAQGVDLEFTSSGWR